MSLFWQETQRKRAQKDGKMMPKGEFPESNWRRPDLPSDNWLNGVRNLAVDVETYDPELTSKGPGVRRDGYIIGVAIGTDDGRRFYYPVRHNEGHAENYPPELLFKILAEDFAQYEGNVCGANLLYDLDYLAQEGVHFPKVNRLHDVQIAEPLIDENRMTYSLDALGVDYLGEHKVEDTLKQAADAYGFPNPKKWMRDIHPKYVGPYAEGDVDMPLRIFALQHKRMAQEGLLKVFDMECRLIPLMLAMRRRGVKVDLNRAEEVKARMNQKLVTAQGHLDHIAGTGVQVWANDSLARVFDKQGIKYNLTKTGKPSFTKPWLEAHPSDLAKHVMEVRRMEKFIGTFLDGYIMGYNIDGRIHAQFNQLKSDDSGTVSGRFSSSNPNLQNIPSRDPEIGPLVRSIFIPEDGDRWERLDWSQIEYRILAHYAMGDGAQLARDMYNEDPKTDFHKMCAEMAGIDPEDSVKRKKVKNVNFLAVYGGGAATAAETMGVTLKEAEEFLELYHTKLPFVKHTLKAVQGAADARGYIKTIMGRRRHFETWQPRDWDIAREFMGTKDAALEFVARKIRNAKMQGHKAPRAGVTRYKTYAALNSLLQGSAGDLMKLAMVEVWESGVCDTIGAPLSTVHDELNMSVPDNKAGDDAVAEVQHIMETCMQLKVPIIAERETGANWGNCK